MKPFESKIENTIEIFNEITILICSYHLFLFTDFVQDETISYNAGWSFLCFVAANVFVNMAISYYETISNIFTLIRRLYARLQAKTAKKEALIKYNEQLKKRDPVE